MGKILACSERTWGPPNTLSPSGDVLEHRPESSSYLKVFKAWKWLIVDSIYRASTPE